MASAPLTTMRSIARYRGVDSATDPVITPLRSITNDTERSAELIGVPSCRRSACPRGK
jgi:hypothetical protein